MNNEERTIQRDRMRYIKNSLAANLALVGLLPGSILIAGASIRDAIVNGR